MARSGTGSAKGNASGELTPLLRQYMHIKSQHPDHILFFRCGDFYEMFHDDARLVSQVLGITLTSRGTGPNGEPIALAGVPYHSVDPYLARLVRGGYRVAICEQMENPKYAKGVVKREVVRVVSPGTVLEDNLLDNKSNNYLVGIHEEKGAYGLAALDFSTGQFSITEFQGRRSKGDCASEIARLAPAEVVLAREQRADLEDIFGWAPARTSLVDAADSGETPVLPRVTGNDGPLASVTRPPSIAAVDGGSATWYAARNALLKQLGVRDLNGFGAEECRLGVSAAGLVLEFLAETQHQQMIHVNQLRVYHPGSYMTLDATTQRSLELVCNLTDASRRHTLLEVLDQTSTSMGGRMLRAWILQPLRDSAEIGRRLDAVESFARSHASRQRAAELLRGISDLERIVSRAACRTANARDLLALRNSLRQMPPLRELLATLAPAGADPDANAPPLVQALAARLDPMPELAARLEAAVNDNPPVTVREGGLIKPGYHPPLDELRSVAGDSKTWIATMRQQEIDRTGISNLKIGFNKVFGYFIEVSNSQLSKVPPEYMRKQTLVGAERFITPELKEKEEIILHAEEKIQELEFQLFEQLCAEVCGCARPIQQTAQAVAETDALLSLAQAAVAGNYCRPEIVDGDEITVHDGRHPVLEALDLDQPFVPNDTCLDNREHQVLIITGPNMAGKSTYIRQVALITLMAHMGSFVPAKTARICTVDRIFTRVGAMDQLAKGQSTFLVEMSETANILNNATDRSLVILDEIGRGTSTYDGLSIAWSVIEYLHNTAGRRPKTLFATHYHELVELEGTLERVKNYNVAVLEEADRVAFLYKILRGSTDRSYGIYAAQVAGLPKSAIARAKEILAELEDGNSVSVHTKGRHQPPPEKYVQLTLFDALDHPVVERLRTTDCEKLTPLQALALLAELAAEARKK